MILCQLIAALSSPLWMVAHATGDIKQYQIVISIISILIVPVSFVVLQTGLPPYYILVFQILLNIIIFIYRLLFARAKVGFPISKYMVSVLLRCIILSVIIAPLPIFMSMYAIGLWQNFIVIVVSVFLSGCVFFFLGVDRATRNAILSFVISKLRVL